jgi:alpha-tubulin suppressor-like RCC1 family protein
MTPRSAGRYALALLLVLGWLGGCSGDNHMGPPPPPPLPQRAVVSAPHQIVGGALASLTSGGDAVFYVSMPTGTVPGAAEVKIQNLRTSESVTTFAIDGGFDPVSLTGSVGDSVQIWTLDPRGGVLASEKLGVPSSAPPIVIRTQPPKKSTDVPLNDALLIYFSEPVDAATLAPPSIQLLQGRTSVSGSVRFADSAHVSVVFVPDASLAPNAAYQLVVTSTVLDLGGLGLSAPDTIPFVTGTTTTGPTASVTLTTDTLRVTGLTYQMSVRVHDAAGNELADRPVVWAVDNSGVFSISATGLLTVHAEGGGAVQATVDGISSGWKSVYAAGGPVAKIVVSRDTTLTQGDQTTLGATLTDALGRLLSTSYHTVTWSNSAPGVATAVTTYPGAWSVTVTAATPGTTTITATSEGVSGAATVTVTPPPPVATVTLSLDSATLLKDATVQLSAILRSATGYVIHSGVTVSWSSDQPTVARVDPNGLVTAIGAGTAAIMATSEGKSDTATVRVTVIRLASVVAGDVHSCGVAISGAAYCWGDNTQLELGGGGVTYDPSSVPSPVVGGLSFSEVSPGYNHTCGLNGGVAYCWGDNSYGESGSGAQTESGVPLAVSGGLSFALVRAGDSFTCALTVANAVYCWGWNGSGQIGDSSTVERPAPVPVKTGGTFTAVSVGNQHSCALSTGGAVYCWGSNGYGQLGDSTTSNHSAPVLVKGALTFAGLAAGGRHSCGLTASGAAYCWGDNTFGQLGNGTTSSITSPTLAPVAVTGGLSFTAIAAGFSHSCGLMAAGAVYCWGANDSGQLGDNTTTGRAGPVLVAGGFTFSSLSARGASTCGYSTTGVAYCWGNNTYWQLGNGSTGPISLVPTRVAGQP